MPGTVRVLPGLRTWAIALGCAATLSSQIITTVAGTDWVFPANGKPAVDAPLGGNLTGIAFDPDGNLLIADPGNNMIHRVDANGILRVVAGTGARGSTGDGGPALQATFNRPLGVISDRRGNIYVADSFNQRVRRIALDGTVATVAGTGIAGSAGDGGPASRATVNFPRSLAIDLQENLYISEGNGHRIRRVAPDGTIATFAGTGNAGFSGDGGPATAAALNNPLGIVFDTEGALYIADRENHRIRRVARDGVITTFAGSGGGGRTGNGGPALNAEIRTPNNLAFGPDGALYISHFLTVRKVSTNGIVSQVAGTGLNQFSGDGGPATAAGLFGPFGVAFDPAGNLFLAENMSRRVRRVGGDGIINTVAGNSAFQQFREGSPALGIYMSSTGGVSIDSTGTLLVADRENHRVLRITPQGATFTVAGTAGSSGFGGDGGPATSAPLNEPYAAVADAAGNIYITDSLNHRIRRVTPNGVISTVAGSGSAGFSGDGGRATQAQLNTPRSASVDAAGNLYIADQFNNRVRKVTPDGNISTVAGTGAAAFGGDGGPATAAGLFFPLHVAFDAAGGFYIADFGNNRIRYVNAAGVISTVAGNGRPGFSGDGGAAIGASFNPCSVALDAAENLYIADCAGNNRIRRVSRSGVITTLAGDGPFGFRGDGGPAVSARLSAPHDVVVDASGRILIADRDNNRVRAILPAAPAFSVSPASLSFSASSGGAPTGTQSVNLSTAVPGLAFTVSGAPDWLRVNPAGGSIPSTLQLSADPSALNPGAYTATLTVTAPLAAPTTRTVAVTFNVGPPVDARLEVEQPGVSFGAFRGGRSQTRQINVLNRGSGQLPFSATSEVTGPQGWLTTVVDRASATASAPGLVRVVADPSQLAAGTYRGVVTLASASTAEAVRVPVTLSVTGTPQTIQLSQSGLAFTSVVNGGIAPAQSFAVLNTGQGVMNWTATPSTASGGNWLSVRPVSGTTDAAAGVVPEVDVSVNPSGLTPGEYFGQVAIAAGGATNSPQIVSIVLEVLAAGSNPGPVVRPAGLVFTRSGAAAQRFTVSNLSGTGVTFSSGRVTSDGSSWFEQVPVAGTVEPDGPLAVSVQPTTEGLAPGIRRGAITLLFTDGSLRTVNLLSVLTAGGEPAAGRAAHSACTGTQLIPVFTLLPQDFTVATSRPVPVEARVVDDCGHSLAAGSVVATFSNGDAPLSLIALKDGRWSGTWQPRNTRVSQVTVTITAEDPAQNLRGSAQVTGGIRTNQTAPAVASGAVVSAASFSAQAPLAPGSLITIFGSRLADAAAASPRLPLETQLGETRASLAGIALPLMFANDSQINAMLPYGIAPNTQHQLVVRRGFSIGVPETITVAEAQPAIFTKDQSGRGQGVILSPQNRFYEPGNPARAGDVAILYCTGLGAVTPEVAAGSPAPGSPLATIVQPATLTIGGVPAQVLFAGLTPGFTGLYQVNAVIPSGVAAGDAVEVNLTVAGLPSPPVTMSVR